MFQPKTCTEYGSQPISTNTKSYDANVVNNNSEENNYTKIHDFDNRNLKYDFVALNDD